MPSRKTFSTTLGTTTVLKCETGLVGDVLPLADPAGLEEAWERAKPAGSTVTVKDKLKALSKQNSPHWESWRSLSA